MQTFWDLSTYIIPLFLAIILHEVAHGWMAYKLGDNTAKNMGRLTLNPVRHIDPIGSILVPALLFISKAGFMFGWSKPVPVRFSALNDTKRDMGMVALAGPLCNFILGVFAFFVAILIQKYAPANLLTVWLFDTFRAFLGINLALCAFNLLPILPLDGGRILVSLLPKRLSVEFEQTERYGFVVLMTMLFFLPMLGIDVISAYMQWMMSGLMDLLSFFI